MKMSTKAGLFPVVAFVALSGAWTGPVGAAISFIEPSSTPVRFPPGVGNSSSVLGLGKGDFNGDGIIDFAFDTFENIPGVGSRAFVSVMLGNGDGTFQGRVTLPLATQSPGGLLVRDFDQDGMPDVLLVEGVERRVAFFRGRGDGTLAAAVYSGTTDQGDSLQTADLDGDGKLDIVVNNIAQQSLSVLNGVGNGTFGTATIIAGAGADNEDLVLFDIDKANRADIVAAGYGTYSVRVWLNDGAGHFPGAAIVTNSVVQPAGVYAGDFDGDLVPDLVVGGAQAGAFLKGNGNGSFVVPGPAQQFLFDQYGGRKYSDNVTPDLDGDGNLDFVLTFPQAQHNYVGVGLGDGAGHFAIRQYVASPGPDDSANAGADGTATFSVVVHDFDGDGQQDVSVSTANGSGRPGDISILFGAGNGILRAPVVYPTAFTASQSRQDTPIALADFTGDGKTDVAFLDYSTIEVLPGNGDGTLGAGAQVIGPSGNWTGCLKSADFDKDGKPDLVFLNFGLSTVVGFNNGDGTYALVGSSPSDASYAPRNVAIGDFNGDTYPDLAVYTWRPGSLFHADVFLYVPGTPRTFARSANFPATDFGAYAGFDYTGIAAGDLDNDGKTDILTMSSVGGPGDTQRILFLRGKGDGTFFAATIVGSNVSRIYEIKIADLNHDSDKDAVLSGDGNTWVLLSNGNGTFAAPVAYPMVGSGQYVTLDDFDGDGELDMAVAVSGSRGGLGVRRGNGNGTFGSVRYFAVGVLLTYTAASADLNGDTKKDLVVFHNSAQSAKRYLTVLLNDSGPRASLSITKIAVPHPTRVTFTITVTNNGPDTATNVTVRDPLRQEVQITSATPSQGTCTADAIAISCALGSLASGASAAVTVEGAFSQVYYGSATNTASVTSSVKDVFTGDNGATTSAAATSALTFDGAADTRVGESYDYTLTYVNPTITTLTNVYLVVTLPFTAEFQGGSAGVTRYEPKNQIFWHFASIAPGGVAKVSFHTTVPWGIPAHTPQAFVPEVGWVAPAGSPLDVTPYVQFVPVTVLSTVQLGAAGVDAALSADAELDAIYDEALARGFTRIDAGQESALSDGGTQLRLWLVNVATKTFGCVARRGGISVFLTLNPGDISLFDTDGGMQLLIEGGSPASRVLLGGWPVEHSVSQGTCMTSCLTEKLGLLGLSFFLGSINKLTGSQACADCLGTGNPIKCGSCAVGFGESSVPGAAVTAGLALKTCLEDCKECKTNAQQSNPKCHSCVPGTTFGYCGSAPWTWRMFGSSQVYYKYTCLFGGYWELGYSNIKPDLTQCPDQPIPPTKVGEVTTAHDPNFKSGPAGDVVNGQTLPYAIDYENIGEATAFSVSVVDPLPLELDETTLVIADGGTYSAPSRSVRWNVGNLAAGAGGTVHFTAKVRAGTPVGTVIANTAYVIFPSVPEVTPTNPVVSTVRAVAAFPQTLSTTQGASLPITLQCADPNDLALSYTIVAAPFVGTLTGTPPAVTYNADPLFTGVAAFTFKTNNGIADSLPASVTITVNPATSGGLPPQVVKTQPASGGTIPVDALLVAYFSKALDEATTTSAQWQVVNGVTPVPGLASFDGTTNAFIFRPNAPLTPATTYRATLLTTIEDTAGHALPLPYTFTFSTRGTGLLQFDPNPAAFGTVSPGATRDLTLNALVGRNAAHFHFASAALTGPEGSQFTILDDQCSGNTLAALGTCTLTLRLASTVQAAGDKNASLAVTADASASVPVTAVVGLRGDANGNLTRDVVDVFHLINFLFAAGPPPAYSIGGDVNGSGVVDVLDVFYLINFLFAAGTPPPA
jgi:uncharacterized repeat protein (TIGR01451 family)